MYLNGNKKINKVVFLPLFYVPAAVYAYNVGKNTLERQK